MSSNRNREDQIKIASELKNSNMNNARKGLVIPVLYMVVNHFVHHPIYLNTQIFTKYLVGIY